MPLSLQEFELCRSPAKVQHPKSYFLRFLIFLQQYLQYICNKIKKIIWPNCSLNHKYAVLYCEIAVFFSFGNHNALK